MSAMEPGMEAMLDTFIHETDTMLEQLDEILMESERAKNINVENINSIFRITHTIKSSAAMMGFTSVSKLSHSVEDVFYIIREHPEKLALIFDSIFDLVFQTSDFLKHELELIQDADYVENSSDHLIAALEEQAGILNGASEEAPAKTDETHIMPRVVRSEMHGRDFAVLPSSGRRPRCERCRGAVDGQTPADAIMRW